MCRLLAWVAPEPCRVGEIVGQRSLAEFVALSGVHRDGWGLAWDPAPWPAPGITHIPQVVRSASCAAEDPRFSGYCDEIYSNAGIAHLRWATPGMAVRQENSHPFRAGDLTMAHNGGIYPLDRVHEILPPSWESEVEGTTDSERYVLAVAAGRRTGRPIADVLTDVIVRLFEGWTPTSLNAVCLTPESLVVVSAFNPYAPVSAVPQPAEQYYALRYQTSPQGVVVASSGIDQPVAQGWRLLDNMTLLVIDRASGELSIRPLPVTPPVAWDAGRTTPKSVR